MSRGNNMKTRGYACVKQMCDELRCDLQRIQGFIKRDPESYVEEFGKYFSHFKKTYSAQLHRLDHANPEFILLMEFIGSTVRKFPNYTESFINILFEIIKRHAFQLDSDIRMTTCKIMCRFLKENVISTENVMDSLIELFNCKDKALRSNLFHLIMSIFKIKSKGSNLTQLSKNSIQSNFYKKLSSKTCTVNVQYACLCIMSEMWRRQIWRDDRTANAIASAVFSPHYRVSYLSLMCLKGYMAKIKEIDIDEEEDAEEAAAKINRENKRSRVHGTSRTEKRRKRQLEKLTRVASRVEKARKNDQDLNGDTSLIRSLYGPQEYCDKLFLFITKSKNKFDYKLLGLEVISRIIGHHSLILPSFYQFCTKYLRPHQKGVVKILTCLAQASHELVPPDFLKPVVETIDSNFLSLQNAAEVCSVGINSIREIYRRAPLAAEELIAQDVVSYAHERKAEKAVVSAARSVLQLLRVVNPSVLAKKDRIRSKEVAPSPYGSVKTHDSVPGVELLGTGADTSQEDSDSSEPRTLITDSEICTREIFSDKDFRRIRKLTSNSSAPDNNVDQNSDNDEQETDGILSTDAIHTYVNAKEAKSRQADRPKLNPHKNWRFNAKASTTNVEKTKSKPFLMVKHKTGVHQKKSRSFRQRVACLKRALERKRRSKV